MYRCCDVKYVLENVLPVLPHGNDGLIFTPVDQPYKAGTDENLFKWKPPYLNSVDFELNIQRGYYLLNIYDNGKPAFEDWASVSDELKTKLQEYTLPIIVECVRDPSMTVTVPNTESYNKADETIRSGEGGWKIIRLRDDKMRPNEKHTLDKINISIADNLIEEDLVKALTRKRSTTSGINKVPLKRIKNATIASSNSNSDNGNNQSNTREMGKLISKYEPMDGTNGMVFIGNSNGKTIVKYFQDAKKQWPRFTNMKGLKLLKGLIKKTKIVLDRNMEIICSSISSGSTNKSAPKAVEQVVKDGHKIYVNKPTYHRTRKLGRHGDGEHVTWSQREYGMPGLQRTYLEMKSYQRFTEMWSLLERAHIYGLFNSVNANQPLRVASLGGGPGFELLAFQEFFKLKKLGPKNINFISADLEKTWGEYVNLLGFDFIHYNLKDCNFLSRANVQQRGKIDFLLVSAVMEMYMSNEESANDLANMLSPAGGVKAVLVVSRSSKLSAHRLMEKRGVRAVPLFPNGNEKLSLLLSPTNLNINLCGNFNEVVPIFPDCPPMNYDD